MTGAKYKDVPQWISSLDKMRSLNASYLVPSHTVPVLGYENVTDVLTSYRDGYSFCIRSNCSLLEGFNARPADLEVVILPQYLRDHPWLQERYGGVFVVC